MAKLGYCCKWISTDPDEVTSRNMRSTTIAWLNRQTRSVAENRLWEIMDHNVRALALQVEHCANLTDSERMFRIGSDVLPAYTHMDWKNFWNSADVQTHLEKIFRPVGDRARELNVKLSFHPGQFVVISSDKEDVRLRSIEEFEYHATMARMMGYGDTWHSHGFKINIHLSGRARISGFRKSLSEMSDTARNLITLENDEITSGIDDLLELDKEVAIVLDIHHHYCHTGEYLSPYDDRVLRIRDSWRGVRPSMHYSQSREDLIVGHDPEVLPDLNSLLNQGFRIQKLRAHSELMWNQACNRWALDFLENFDIQVEAKAKNVARDLLFQQAIKMRLL